MSKFNEIEGLPNIRPFEKVEDYIKRLQEYVGLREKIKEETKEKGES